MRLAMTRACMGGCASRLLRLLTTFVGLAFMMHGKMPAQYKLRMADALLFLSMHPNGEPLAELGR